MYFDLESNIVSLEIASGKIDHVLELGNFLIHVNKNNAPLLIEILDGGKFVSQFKKVEGKKFIESAMPANN
ncbi:hypothetical protein COU00_00155 [Candidatus Falkowbacteria bacterium CG10_big_fil_rev_8_21_14_0_10_43_11]|uniref:DUF2283 domain-containing protein n=1 Tax=Candidatus Falkowbacteria bacterium CG10_big_fil_rev_8_21_14_0_10_43_11 TaxID=1974568 RepID=A0A2M6WN85_9BACT|nr:MAG: hypothetical protein COU00_00155 [Candidatus Falkowbacteria bacterium CG10_big_fil_rev_8_21_14_0_10_43_11]